MRELKFRQWHEHSRRWKLFTLPDVSSGYAFVLEGDTIEQYTGLKDTKGKDIYEGDILQSDRTRVREFRRVVGFRHGQFGFEGQHDATLWFPLSGHGSVGKWFVVGNIHETPELVGGK